MAQQPDEVIATKGESTFTPHPEGQFAAVCVDVINFGEKVEQYQGKPERLTPKCGIVFFAGQYDEDGNPQFVQREFSTFMSEKANLRKFLEAWRGKSYSDDEVEAGAPLHKLVNAPALLTVEHAKVGDRTYANISSVARLPDLMKGAIPTVPNYERPKFLEDRKAKYAEEAKKYRDRIGAPVTGKALAGAAVGASNDDDDLPF